MPPPLSLSLTHRLFPAVGYYQPDDDDDDNADETILPLTLVYNHSFFSLSLSPNAAADQTQGRLGSLSLSLSTKRRWGCFGAGGEANSFAAWMVMKRRGSSEKFPRKRENAND